MRFFILPLVLLFVACEGPEGAVGPQGERGLPGEQGIPGDPGPPGNANVQAVTFTLDADQFNHEDQTAAYSRDMSEITSEVTDSGLVLAFTNLGGDAGWFSLPYVAPISGFTTVVMSYAYGPNEFSVLIQSSNETNYASAFDGHGIKVIIIPQGASKAGIDLTDYEAVARHYGL